jgi:acetyl-CoA carboxylase biotin carboxyl carrier protein
MNYDQIEKLMARLEASKLRKLVIKKGDFEIQLEKEGCDQPAPPMRSHAPMPFADESSFTGERGGHHHHSKAEVEGKLIKSPLVGTYYSRPSPNDPDFVKVGDHVKQGQVLCIIEAMKVMNEIEATASGVIKKIHVESGQPVEHGHPLFEIHT